MAAEKDHGGSGRRPSVLSPGMKGQHDCVRGSARGVVDPVKEITGVLSELKPKGVLVMGDAVGLPDDLSAFIASSHWTFAKTMPQWPHEYIVRGRVDERLFVKLIRHIRANGYQGRFYGKTLTYYDAEGMVYWTMGAPLEKTIIINRCRKEDSYECRLLKGTLPASNNSQTKQAPADDAAGPPA